MGWKDAPVISESWQDAPLVEEEKKKRDPQRTLGESAVRAGGLGVRDLVQGAMSLPNIVGDAANTAINYGSKGINALAGTNIPMLGLPSEATPRLLTNAGLPQPESGAEHISGAINQAVVGFAPWMRGAQLAGDSLKGLPFIQSMLTKPVAETAAVATGAGASEATKQMGGGTAAQMIAGAVTPMAMTGAMDVARRGATAVNELRRPLTQKGAEQIAADVLGRTAQDKTKALSNLERYNQLVARGDQVGVPGAQPTAAAVAGDYGLSGGYQLVAQGEARPQFAAQGAISNEARATDLSRLNATERAVESYKAKRDAITAPLRDNVFDNAKGMVDYGPVAEHIGYVATSAAGGKAESEKALSWIAKRLQRYAGEGRQDPRNAYALYQDIGDLVAGKIKDDNGAALKLAGGLANEVKKVLGQQIELAAPGFKNYLEHYARLSKPIDRLEEITNRLGGENLSRVTNAGMQATDNGATYTISQAKMKGAAQDLSKLPLAPRQRDILERVLGDLNAETFASTGGKRPGSDTYQNIAAANFTNRVLGETLGESGLGKMAARPLAFAYKPLESRINDLIVKAYQDPKLMEELLKRARTSRGSPTLAGLLSGAGQQSSAGLLGSVLGN